MTGVVRLRKPGGIDELEVVDVELSQPGMGEILIRQPAIGANFLDIYHRTGVYSLPALPAVLGGEGAGGVTAGGPDRTTLKTGDRTADEGAPVAESASDVPIPVDRAVG